MTEEREEFEFDDFSDMTEEEQRAQAAAEIVLDPESQKFVDDLLDKLMSICDMISDHHDPQTGELKGLYPYQRPAARRIFESLILDDGELISAVFSRQSGKSELVADVVVTAMIFLPRLAKVFPEWLGKYANGLWVGAFAPVEDQADTLYGRIVERLTSESTVRLMEDPEITERVIPKGKVHVLKHCGSLVRRSTCNPRATIEGKTYHLILIDEAQGADETMYSKSVSPMGAATNATTVMTGTPDYVIGIFYKMIQDNKRKMLSGRRTKVRQNHFEVDYREAAKANKQYAKYVRKEMFKLGFDSDEFKLSYRIMWLLDQGMFTTIEALEEMGDISMQSTVSEYYDSPVVVGIDCGRKQDKTVVTVVWVGWEREDQMGFYEHRILDWLDLSGIDWEEQYFQTVDFLKNYNVWKVGIDVNGLGDTFCQRMKLLMPTTEIVELGAGQSEQSERWKYLKQLLDRRKIGWPAGSRVKRLKKWRRFIQEMTDLQLVFQGPHVLAEAPNVKDAHDDYPDSLAMACILTKEEQERDNTVSQHENMFYRGRKQRGRR